DRYPTAVDRLEASLGGGACIGGQLAILLVDELWKERQAERGFHLASVVFLFLEDLVVDIVQRVVPVAQEYVRVLLPRQLAEERLHLVAAMAVEQHDL